MTSKKPQDLARALNPAFVSKEPGEAIPLQESPIKLLFIAGRVGGPTIICQDGTKEWYMGSYLHRTDGPAIEWSDGSKAYWYRGVKISEEEYFSKEFQVKMVMEE